LLCFKGFVCIIKKKKIIIYKRTKQDKLKIIDKILKTIDKILKTGEARRGPKRGQRGGGSVGGTHDCLLYPIVGKA
jgi:hypothetical protein